MDDEKRTVLVAALSAYASLLRENAAQLEREKGKGKSREGDDDVDVASEVRNQISICNELCTHITSASSSKDIARAFGGSESRRVISVQRKELPSSWR